MADQTQNTALDSLREEMGKLAAQVQNFVNSHTDKKGDDSNELLDKLLKEMASLRQSISKSAQSGVEEVENKVRGNPLTSLLIAFGAGCVISCLIRHLTR